MPPPAPAPVQSYPTFWDAIPVESPPPPPTPPDDAYTLCAAEDSSPVTLSVDQLDVG